MEKTNPKNQITTGTTVTHINTEQRWRASNAWRIEKYVHEV